MTTELEFTGERFIPGVDGEIVYEHVHRYAFARSLVAGKRVLDVACGEGYGSALLGGLAQAVTGIDIDAATIAHARERYAHSANLAFLAASATALPLADASVDVIVSFETIEHLPAADQPRMLAEFARVLTPDGLVVLSAPNRIEYSHKRDFRNPFHLHEHDRDELDGLLATHFAARAYFRQRMWMGSTIWSERSVDQGVAAWVGGTDGVEPALLPDAMYYLVLAAADATMLPPQAARVSLFADAAGSEIERGYAAEREAMRLDALLGERTRMLDTRTQHVQHLERLVALRDGIIAERDALLRQQVLRMMRFEGQEQERDARDAIAQRELAAAREAALARDADIAAVRQQVADSQAQHAQAQLQLAAQERIIDHRHSWQWWRALPGLRLRAWWNRLRSR
ncbi:MAG: class I SAM-dependent methyltransferase [Casimicrobiaceae bacterium]